VIVADGVTNRRLGDDGKTLAICGVVLSFSVTPD
jgi:hypothetical protein